MDPNSPAPAPTPEQPTPQTTQPIQQAPQPTLNDPQPQVPAANGLPPQKPNKKAIAAIIGGVILAILLVVGIILTTNALNKEKTTDSNKSAESSINEEADETATATAEPIVAKQLVELRAACVGGSASNAGDYKKPYSYVIYENNNKTSHSQELRDKSLLQPYKEEYGWDLYAVGTNDETVAQTLSSKSDPSELNVVVCLSRDDSTAVKTMTCELNRSAEMEQDASTVANYNSVQYKVTLYEAQTGKKIKDLAPINGPATECPTTAYYTPESPDIYGDPDAEELDAALNAFEKQ